jgi:hypothetical protein
LGPARYADVDLSHHDVGNHGAAAGTSTPSWLGRAGWLSSRQRDIGGWSDPRCRSCCATGSGAA